MQSISARIRARKLNQLTTLAHLGKGRTVYLKELTDAYAQVSSLLSKILKKGQASTQTMEQYRQTLTLEVNTTTLQLKDLARELEKRVGKTSEEFGRVISQEQERMKRTPKLLFWISMIPNLVLVVWELIQHI